MTHDRAITDKREILANDMIHWLQHYKTAISQEDEITEAIALGKIESFTIELFPEKQSQDLAEDTIMIALGIAGYKPHDMNQFKRASVLLDMAQELKALTDKRHTM